MRIIFLSLFLLLSIACSSTYPNQNITGKVFPSVVGESLEKNTLNIPGDFTGDHTLLLIGYKQKAQFDIDRWFIGLDMTNTKVDAYEVPTIQGLFPRLIKPVIDNGMRKGIPEELWKDVITVYKDGAKLQTFTGNENPNNARVILLDKKGVILYFYDRGFSVNALNEVRKFLVQ